jgi:predicted HTH transcriptional regulator
MYNFDEDDDIFRHYESNTLELKTSFNNSHMNKYIETVCAFMNSNGGSIIYGITDNGNMVGVSITNKKYDNIKIKFDNIYHGNKILMVVNNTIEPLHYNLIHIKKIKNKKNKWFIVVNITSPIKYSEYNYCILKNGDIYLRLNTSNIIKRNVTFYSQEEHEKIIDIYVLQIELLKKELKKYNEPMHRHIIPDNERFPINNVQPYNCFYSFISCFI